ncbi:MAG TPA: hypothetical protein VHX18_00780 [Rhizomicrobium sp.]|jgi:hypothetical protein|nr:hypothetical protein [Rhizomicrobium sp.]
MRSLKHFVVAATVAALTLSNVAMAGESLAPGKPASVKQAQLTSNETMIAGIGLAVVAIAVTIGVSSGGGSGSSAVTGTTSTSTTS